jgi:hypothetical protein
LSQLIQSEEFLPDLNGKSYTHQDLIRDLTRYSLISNQEGGAIGFRQYIPIEVFDKYGITDIVKATAHPLAYTQHNLLYNSGGKALEALLGSEVNENGIIKNQNNISENIMQAYINKLNKSGEEKFKIKGKDIEVLNKNNEKYISNFVKQYFQHNPEDAYLLRDLELSKVLDIKDVEKINSFIAPGDSRWFFNDFVSIRSQEGRLYLYQNNGGGTFLKVGKLGWFGMNEYDYTNPRKVSVFPDNNKGVVMIGNSTVAVETQNPVGQEAEPQGISLKSTLEKISRSDSKYSEVADFFMKYYDPEVKVEKSENLQSKGAYSSNNKTIYLNSNLWNNNNAEQNREVFLHEYMHSLTKDLINKHVRLTFDERGELEVEYLTAETPKGLTKLISVYRFAVDKLKEEYGIEKFLALNEKFKEDKAKMSNEVSYSSEDMDVYHASDVNEFIAGIFFDDQFRNKMMKIEYKSSEKSLLMNFVEALLKMYYSLFGGGDTVAQHTVDAVVSLLETSHNLSQKPSSLFEEIISAEMVNNDEQAESLVEETIKALDGNEMYSLMVKHEFDDNIIRFFLNGEEREGLGIKMYVPGYADLKLYLYRYVGVSYIVNTDTKQTILQIKNADSELEAVTEFADYVNTQISSGAVENFEEIVNKTDGATPDTIELVTQEDVDEVEECE